MPRDARFWRNVTIIAVAHIAIVIALVRWNRETRRPNLQSIVWLSGGSAEVAGRNAPAPAIATMPSPEADTPLAKPEEQHEAPVPTSARSDIQLPIATPSPVPTPLPKPSMTPVPKASVRPTAKATAKPTPKKPAEAKATPKPSPKKSTTPVEQKKANDEARRELVKVAPVNADGSLGRFFRDPGPC